MKTQTQTLVFPVEVEGVAGLVLTISVSAVKELLPTLDVLGFGSQELPNKINAVLQQARDACDGSVEGLIVSNRED